MVCVQKVESQQYSFTSMVQFADDTSLIKPVFRLSLFINIWGSHGAMFPDSFNYKTVIGQGMLSNRRKLVLVHNKEDSFMKLYKTL